MVNSLAVDWQGQEFALLPEFAVFWESHRTLIIADPHFGKDSSFRAAGIPIPGGTTERDVEVLNLLIDRHSPARLIVLGDFFHSKSSRSGRTMDVLSRWREKNKHLEIINIAGNHDRHAGDPPKEWFIGVEQDPWSFGGIPFRHFPADDNDSSGICGHVHPGVRLAERNGNSMVLPCFWMTPNQLIVPAFGGFTGKGRIKPLVGDRVFVTGEGRVLEILMRKQARR